MANKTFICKYCGKIATPCSHTSKSLFCNEKCYLAYARRNAKENSNVHDAETCEKVNIVITKDLELLPGFNPTVGERYLAEKYQYQRRPGYVVNVNGNRVCVRYGECEEVQ